MDKLRLLVKLILHTYKYPPDRQEAVVRLVLERTRQCVGLAFSTGLACM
ncbi:DUF3387 domain-containing protein [Pseudomonas aeruginosa]|nr:type I restriction enzyme endonuclease domain-containing protein [Pseudomonas aeruginosa]MDI3611682.1 DUF3387 domain-containing protein [Pseudomonas aeruginosa]MDI4012101.1 DUF3387 domain-containing protein [Pseudomonas aeruginosa]MDI4025033.1 DUF3387 domain-containing protein [Pseudomonas aeruginosa]